MTREWQLTIDAADPGALGQFWAAALGYVQMEPPGGHATWDEALAAMGVPPERFNDANALVDPDGHGPRIFLQRVPDAKRGKNRLHIDVRGAPGLEGEERMAALEEEARRLVAIGATRIERFEPAPPLGSGWIVLADPEGNEFCLD